MEKLREMLLFESYFNFANNIYFGCHLVYNVEEYVILPKEQNGGRLGHTSIKNDINDIYIILLYMTDNTAC